MMSSCLAPPPPPLPKLTKYWGEPSSSVQDESSAPPWGVPNSVAPLKLLP